MDIRIFFIGPINVHCNCIVMPAESRFCRYLWIWDPKRLVGWKGKGKFLIFYIEEPRRDYVDWTGRSSVIPFIRFFTS